RRSSDLIIGRFARKHAIAVEGVSPAAAVKVVAPPFGAWQRPVLFVAPVGGADGVDAHRRGGAAIQAFEPLVKEVELHAVVINRYVAGSITHIGLTDKAAEGQGMIPGPHH